MQVNGDLFGIIPGWAGNETQTLILTVGIDEKTGTTFLTNCYFFHWGASKKYSVPRPLNVEYGGPEYLWMFPSHIIF